MPADQTSPENQRPTEPIVWVVDDDEGVLRSMRFLFESVHLRVVTHSSAEDFLREFDPDLPGCIVLDIRMPVMSGLDLQKRLVEMGSTHPIIIVTGHADVPTAVEVMKAGAVTVVQKPFRDQNLINQVQHALQGYIQTRVEKAALDEVRGALSSLTSRQREVLRLVILGNSSKRIAAQLGICQRTVDVHRARIMKKMGVGSAVALVGKVLGAVGSESSWAEWISGLDADSGPG